MFKYANLLLASSDYSNNKVVLTTTQWNEKIGNTSSYEGWITDDTSKSTLHYKFYDDNTEWNFTAFKGRISGNVTIHRFFIVR